MKSIKDKKLIWWRDVPIDVEIGLLTYLSEVWNNDIYVISANDYENSRKQCSWEADSFNNVHMIVGNLESQDNRELIDRLLEEDSINIFSGIKGGQKKYLDLLNKKNTNACVVIMESTNLYGSKFKLILKKIAYPWVYGGYYRNYKTIIKGLFAMGEKAVKQYSSYGWKNIFDFMYMPKLHKSDNNPISESPDNKEIKMLYIGRFDYPTKGVNILMDSIDNLNVSKPWRIDFVGGYGSQKNEVIDWCRKKENVKFIGSWESDSVVDKMSDYDFCIVPSLYDGWNLTPLQAINAGIGCIATDNSGSEELIRNSGAGVVIKTNDRLALTEAIQKAIENSNSVEFWKANAREYADKVSMENVGSYFVEALRYCFGETENKPKCPW